MSQETCKAETGKKATIKYAHNCLKQVEKLEADISKIRKNAKDLGTTLTIKCDEFFNRLDQIEVNEEHCEDVTEIVENLRDVLSFAERKPNKERDLRSIVSCKEYLKGYINNPKTPSQILLSFEVLFISPRRHTASRSTNRPEVRIFENTLLLFCSCIAAFFEA